MPQATTIEQAALCLTPLLLAIIALLGSSANKDKGGAGQIAIAIVVALGGLMLAVLPGVR